MKKSLGVLGPLAVAAALFASATGANASLVLFESYVGQYGVSTDGFGSLNQSGVISASAPAGSTVVAAYLYSSVYSGGTPTATLNGSAVTFGPNVANLTACCNLASARADVTSIVAPIIDGGAGGVYNFDVVETGGSTMDGEALVVVYENAGLLTSTVAILDGWASVDGDSASLNFAEALAPGDAGFFAEMSLGIGFSCNSQRSTVEVNGFVMTDNAGNFDDGNPPPPSGCTNGNLITVGSFDDPFSPLSPSYADDTERYDLSSFVTDGDTSIVIETANSSQDDNIFLAVFHVSGEAGVNAPPPNGDRVPEPATLGLLGLGLIGMGAARRRRTRRL